MKKSKDKIGYFYVLRKTYPMCFKANPRYFVFNQASVLVSGILSGAIVLITQNFFDSVYSAATGTGRGWGVVIAFIVFILTSLFSEILDSTTNYSFNVMYMSIVGYLNGEIHRKSSLIDPIEFENPDRLNDIDKSTEGVNYAVSCYIVVTLVIMSYIPYLIFMFFTCTV